MNELYYYVNKTLKIIEPPQEEFSSVPLHLATSNNSPEQRYYLVYKNTGNGKFYMYDPEDGNRGWVYDRSATWDKEANTVR